MTKYLFLFTLMTYSSYSIAESYYGYAGSCDDGVYKFDFENLRVTEYHQYRIKDKKWRYKVKERVLIRNDNTSYILWSETNDPAIISIDQSNDIIRGKSVNNNYTFSYLKCDDMVSKKIVNKAIRNSIKPPNKGN